MKTTTQTQLAEQKYSDWLKETQPTDQKAGLAYMFNEYSRHFGLPLTLAASSPVKYVKVCASVVRIYSRWLALEMEKGWGLVKA